LWCFEVKNVKEWKKKEETTIERKFVGPMAKDVVKAAANVKGAAVTYNQGYRAVKAQDKDDVMSNNDSYEVIIPYLHQFQENNPGLRVHYDLIDGKIDSLFLCPSIMNACLWFVRPVMSLDATHLKSKHKGTLYLATVKTGLNDIYAVTIAITRANEGYNGWNTFLIHLKNACSLLEMDHPMQMHNKYAYFTFISDRDKGLVQALKDTFPRNHSSNV
jgi:MULE transposase domain